MVMLFLLWKEEFSGSKGAKIKWSGLYYPKGQGGLGLRPQSMEQIQCYEETLVHPI